MSDAWKKFDLTDRVVVVTGGSRGLGREMVLAMADVGADVVIASRKVESCRALADEVRRATGRRALPVGCHVGSWSDVERLPGGAEAEFGKGGGPVQKPGMLPIV